MISSIEVRNFQSLYHVELELHPLTVIVGKSSSGKSAFTRALRTLTGNARGDAFVSYGERTATITAATDKGTVSLARGGSNEYTLLPNEGDKRVFSKLNGSVPEEVTEFLGIEPRDPLNFANQFDMPYLLTSSAGEVARTLGELTNVHTLFEAAREANRQRGSHATTLKTRAKDFEETAARIDTYRPLKKQLAFLKVAEDQLNFAHNHETRIRTIQTALSTITQAEQQVQEADHILSLNIPDLTEIQATQYRITRLQGLIYTLELGEQQLSTHTAAVTQLASIPTLDQAHHATARLSKYREVIADMKIAATALKQATGAIEEFEDERRIAEDNYAQRLRELGTCPTCHQATTMVHEFH